MASFKCMDWEYKLEELAKKQRFADEPTAVEAELQQLKREVGEELQKRITTHRKAGVPVGIGVAIIALGVLFAALKVPDSIFGVTFGVGIGLTVISAYIRSLLWKRVSEIMDFDETHFEGEIVFKRQNGIAL